MPLRVEDMPIKAEHLKQQGPEGRLGIHVRGTVKPADNRMGPARLARSRGRRGGRGGRGGRGIRGSRCNCTQRGIRSDATSGGGGRLNGQRLEGAYEIRLRCRWRCARDVLEIRGGHQPVDRLRAPYAAPARIPEHGSINEESSDHEDESKGREAACERGLEVSLLKEDLEEDDERRERREGRAQPTNVIRCDEATVALSVDRDVDLKALIRAARRAAIFRGGGECRGVGGHGNDRHNRAIDGGAHHAWYGTQMRQQQLQCRELRVH